MNKLIALVDASPYARSVCSLAGWAALRTGATVEVLHVIGRRDGHADQSNLSGSIGIGARSSLLEELADLDARKAVLAKQRGRAILEDAAELVRATGVSQVEVRLRHEEIVDAVLREEQSAQLVVMGKRGEGANFDRKHLGSNLERVVRASTRPVLVAPETVQPVQQVLIAFDGGASVQRAIDYLAAEPGFHDLQFRLLTVGTPGASIRERQAAAVQQLQAAGCTASADTLPGSPEVVIGEQVANGQADLLVMGAFGHSRIRQMIIGSTTAQVVQACPVAVLLVR